jgi:hypothetical protein
MPQSFSTTNFLGTVGVSGLYPLGVELLELALNAIHTATLLGIPRQMALLDVFPQSRRDWEFVFNEIQETVDLFEGIIGSLGHDVVFVVVVVLITVAATGVFVLLPSSLSMLL